MTTLMKHTLEFEKPIAELQKKLEELKSHEASGSLSVSFQEEIALIENKIRETRETIFSNLTAHQRVMLAAPTEALHPGLHPSRL